MLAELNRQDKHVIVAIADSQTILKRNSNLSSHDIKLNLGLPTMPAGTLARPKTPRPVEVIYSCSICQKTIHELYKHIESDQGFRADNDHYTSEPVTKLWMTECAHLTCSEHLQGGGWMMLTH